MKLLPWMPYPLLIPLFFEGVGGARVLMASLQIPSHVLLQLKLGSELVRRGHDVHVAIASRYPNPEKIEELGIKTEFYHMPSDVLYGVSREYEKRTAETIFNYTIIGQEMSAIVNMDCTFMMNDELFLDKVRSLKFDIAVVEPSILSQCTLILPHYLQIPFVSLYSCFRPWQMRIPALPSFHPLINPYKFFDDSNVLGRMENLFAYLMSELSIFFPGTWNTTLLERFAPQLDSWTDLVRQSELYLVDADHHVGNALPTFPNIISVAGLTCSPSKKLDEGLEMVMSKGDAIVMSFGCLAYDLPKHVMLKFMQAFSRLNEIVVVRISQLEGVEVPKNVKLLSWLPQNDLLGHSNTKLFITHCGISGLHEALYHAIPIIGFPMFADQHLNCLSTSKKRFGLTMNIHSFTADELYANIVEVIKNSTYKQTIQRASRIFLDQPMSPKERAVYWIEHMIKYGGSYLRSPAIDLPLHEFLMVDVLAVLFILTCILYLLAKTIVKKLYKQLKHTDRQGEKLKTN